MTEVVPIAVGPELPDDYVKVCKTCGIVKHKSEFYDHNTNFDRLFHDCKTCANNKRRAKYQKRREIDSSTLDRVQQFVQGYRDPSELDDDEVVGSFIRDNEGKPVHSADLRKRFQSKFTKELGRRVNNFIRQKAPSSVEIIYQIASNDMYEAADRLKAATWLAERVIGKTPEVLIHAQTDNVYVSILDSIEAGSREDYRRSIESSRGGVGEFHSESEILDAEVEGEEFGVDAESFGEGSDEREEESSDGEESSGVQGDGEGNPLAYVEGLRESREEKLARGKAIRKAKQRRYAARAVGATSLTAMPWLMEFVPYELVQTKDKPGGVSGDFYARVCAAEVAVGYKMKLYPPDKQTPGLIERLRAASVEGEDNG